jgi:hypothetical protein
MIFWFKPIIGEFSREITIEEYASKNDMHLKFAILNNHIFCMNI